MPHVTAPASDMLLHNLHLANVGPFVGATSIDFAALGSAGLFLLDGPTGVGKSTILDAIVYALYGQVGGPHASTERMRSQGAPGGEASVIELTFETTHGIFRVRRTPAFERLKRSGAGTTTQQASVKLWRLGQPDAELGELLSSRHGEVEDEIYRAIGLTRRQFLQTVILPQGEFANFLRARPEERRELLTRLFSTDTFDNMTAELDERRRHALDAETRAQQAIAAAKAAFSAVIGIDGDSREALATATNEEAAQVCRRLREDHGRLLAETRDQLDQLRITCARVQTRYQDAAVQRQQWLRYQSLSAEQAELRTVLESMAGAKELISSFETAVAQKSLFENMRSLRDQLDELGSSLAGTTPGETATADIADKILSLRLRANDLQRYRECCEERIELCDEMEELLAHCAQIELEVGAVRERLAAAPGQLATLRDELHACQEAAAAHESLAAEVARWELAAHAHHELDDAIVKEQSLAHRLADSVESAHAAASAHAQLIAARIDGMAAELASQLRPGDDCPVCGSSQHPRPASANSESPTPDDIAVAAQTLADLLRTVEELQVQRADAAAEVAGVRARTAGTTATQCDVELRKCRDARTAAAEALERRSSIESQLEALTQSMTADEERQRELLTALESRKAQLTAADTAVSRIDDRLRDGKVSPETIESESAKVEAQLADLVKRQQLVQQLEKLRARSNEVDAQWQRTRTELGIATDDDYVSLLRRGQEVAQLRAKVESTAARLAAIKTEMDLIPPNAQDAPASEQELAELARAAETAADQLDRLAAEVGHLERSDSAVARQLAAVLEAIAEHRRLAQESAATVRMAEIAAATSAENRLRIPLSTYVLMERFREVLAAANSRLQVMSNGRYALEHHVQLEGRGRKTGLGITVLDHFTGSTRPAGDLSGGETFYTSLALALGLADVVVAENGGVDLGTLFIDEGFGLLDGETLDAVLAEIDALRAHGRVIGLVSHVDELKTRIAERIEIRPVRDGQSVIRVVA